MSTMDSCLSVREEFLLPLRRVLSFLLAQRNSEGAIICPFHRLEHTGKSAGALSLICALARHDPQADSEALLLAARQQAQRLVGRLEREGASTCFTFRPGRHDPYNCSNSVIDGGACSDALVDCVETFGESLSSEERETFTHGAVLSAQTYLRYCILDKGIPAQKAWAMTGVAQAFRLSGHEVLKLSVREGAHILGELQRSDGSYPYHPEELGAPHPGASDASSFYQSRVTGFLAFALERAGLDLTNSPWVGDLQRGVDFLLGLIGPDGIKAGLVEAKPWYWGADHEVASHPFDLYTLGVGLTRLGRSDCAAPLLASFRAWARHILPSGEPMSHLPKDGTGVSYQCPLFWAAHTSWAARALPALEAAAEAKGGEDAPVPSRLFTDVGLMRLDQGGGAAWIRGPRPDGNLHHGSPLGAGLIRVVRADGKILLDRSSRGGQLEGEWYGRGGKSSLGRGWRLHGSELRFSLWMARNALRGGAILRGLGEPWKVLREGVMAYGSDEVSTGFDRHATLEGIPGGARVRGVLTQRDGTPLEGGDFEREYTLGPAGLLVRETLHRPHLAQPLVPKHATGVSLVEGVLSYSLDLGQSDGCT